MDKCLWDEGMWSLGQYLQNLDSNTTVLLFLSAESMQHWEQPALYSTRLYVHRDIRVKKPLMVYLRLGQGDLKSND